METTKDDKLLEKIQQRKVANGFYIQSPSGYTYKEIIDTTKEIVQEAQDILLARRFDGDEKYSKEAAKAALRNRGYTADEVSDEEIDAVIDERKDKEMARLRSLETPPKGIGLNGEEVTLEYEKDGTFWYPSTGLAAQVMILIGLSGWKNLKHNVAFRIVDDLGGIKNANMLKQSNIKQFSLTDDFEIDSIPGTQQEYDMQQAMIERGYDHYDRDEMTYFCLTREQRCQLDLPIKVDAGWGAAHEDETWCGVIEDGQFVPHYTEEYAQARGIIMASTSKERLLQDGRITEDAYNNSVLGLFDDVFNDVAKEMGVVIESSQQGRSHYWKINGTKYGAIGRPGRYSDWEILLTYDNGVEYSIGIGCDIAVDDTPRESIEKSCVKMIERYKNRFLQKNNKGSKMENKVDTDGDIIKQVRVDIDSIEDEATRTEIETVKTAIANILNPVWDNDSGVDLIDYGSDTVTADGVEKTWETYDVHSENWENSVCFRREQGTDNWQQVVYAQDRNEARGIRILDITEADDVYLLLADAVTLIDKLGVKTEDITQMAYRADPVSDISKDMFEEFVTNSGIDATNTTEMHNELTGWDKFIVEEPTLGKLIYMTLKGDKNNVRLQIPASAINLTRTVQHAAWGQAKRALERGGAPLGKYGKPIAPKIHDRDWEPEFTGDMQIGMFDEQPTPAEEPVVEETTVDPEATDGVYYKIKFNGSQLEFDSWYELLNNTKSFMDDNPDGVMSDLEKITWKLDEEGNRDETSKKLSVGLVKQSTISHSSAIRQANSKKKLLG